MDYPLGVCRRLKYHEWESMIQTVRGVKERCKGCGKVGVWRFWAGKLMKPQTYHESHIRDFAQPIGPSEKVFALLYGKEPLWESQKRELFAAGSKKRQEDHEHEFMSEMKKAKTNPIHFL